MFTNVVNRCARLRVRFVRKSLRRKGLGAVACAREKWARQVVDIAVVAVSRYAARGWGIRACGERSGADYLTHQYGFVDARKRSNRGVFGG
jgi:hypothetical protein